MPTQTLPVKLEPAPPAPPAPPTRPWRAWLLAAGRALLFLALIAAPLAVVVHYIAHFAVDVPYWDEWENARFFTVARYGHQSIVELARQQNESRLLIPNLISLLLSLPGNWSVVREMYLEVAMVAVICGALFKLLRHTGFSLPVRSLLLFPIACVLFSLTQHENWFFGIQICYYMVPLTLCLALLVNVSDWPLGRKTVLSLTLAFLGLYSFSGGVLVWLLAFPGWLPELWSARGGWRPTRRELAWHAFYLAGSALMIGVYFWNYTQPGGRGSLLDLLAHAREPLTYFFAWLGSPLFPHEPFSQAVHAGIAAFTLLAALLAACAWRLRHREEQRRLYPWIMLAGYALGTGAITVLGRGSYGIHQALSSRYISFSSYAYVVILVLGAYLWRFHRQRVALPWRAVFLVAALAALWTGGTAFTRAQLASVPWIRDSSNQRTFAREGLIFLPIMPAGQNVDALCGVSEYVQDTAMDLLRRHILNVPLASPSLRESLQPDDALEANTYGALDEPDMDADSHVSIRGWAVDPGAHLPARHVLVTVTPKDGGPTRPLVAFHPNLGRPPLAPAEGDYQQMPCAFMGLVNFDRLAPGDYLVAGWQVDLQTNQAHQLGYAYTFHWARRGQVVRPLDTFVFPPFDPSLQSLNGTLEKAELRDKTSLDVAGWAINVTHAVPPKTVLITLTDAAGATRVVGHAEPEVEYQSVADLYRNDNMRYSGFRTSISLGPLPPGTYRVAAWAVGDSTDDETVAQLGNTFPIQIHP